MPKTLGFHRDIVRRCSGEGALIMKPLKTKIRKVSKQLIGSWITWVVIGAAAGTGVLLSPAV